MLTQRQREICLNTISPNAFYLIVMDALKRGTGLSVVRVADGENRLLHRVPMDPGWLKQFGCLGMPANALRARIIQAAQECQFYAPSLTGITNPAYDLYSQIVTWHPRYVDNQFPNLWSDEQKTQLFQQAKHVLLIHGNRNLADAMSQRAQKYLGVKVSWLPLSNWEQADSVIESAAAIDAPLVIFAAGPASKFIGPRIAKQGKVTLDIGQAMDRWTLLKRFEQEKNKAAAAGRLEEFTKSPYTFQ
jgi:hypothetical protein